MQTRWRLLILETLSSYRQSECPKCPVNASSDTWKAEYDLQVNPTVHTGVIEEKIVDHLMVIG
jgi:hypothetical protein